MVATNLDKGLLVLLHTATNNLCLLSGTRNRYVPGNEMKHLKF